MWGTQRTKGMKAHAPAEVDWTGGYATAYDGHDVYDLDVVKFVLQHTKFIDRFNPKKMIIAAIYAQPMLLGDFKIPEAKKWKFFDKEFNRTWDSYE